MIAGEGFRSAAVQLRNEAISDFRSACVSSHAGHRTLQSPPASPRDIDAAA